jgi:hypothetical protein
MCCVWFGELEVAQGFPIRIIVCHDITDHHKTWIYQSHYFNDFWQQWQDLHECAKGGFYFQELLTMLEVEDFWVWEWCHIVDRKWHPLVVNLDDKITTNQNWNKNNAHRTWHWFNTRVVMKYWNFLWSEYTVISWWTLSSRWCHSSKASTIAKLFLSWNQLDEENYFLRVVKVTWTQAPGWTQDEFKWVKQHNCLKLGAHS